MRETLHVHRRKHVQPHTVSPQRKLDLTTGNTNTTKGRNESLAEQERSNYVQYFFSPSPSFCFLPLFSFAFFLELKHNKNVYSYLLVLICCFTINTILESPSLPNNVIKIINKDFLLFRFLLLLVSTQSPLRLTVNK